MKNLNEQLNRMKSLMSEDRLFGNLVDKKPINEWGKAIDDILKGGSRAAKSADEALDVMVKAEKYFADLKAANQIKEMPDLIDDIAKSKASGSFEVILKDFSRNIDTVDDFVRHFDDFAPIYKAAMTPRNYEIATKFMSKLKGGGNLANVNIMKEIDGVPYFLKLPKEMDFNWIVFQKWFQQQDELVQKQTLDVLNAKPSSGSNVSSIEDLSDMVGKELIKGGDDLTDLTKGGDDLTKGGDDITKGGDDLTKGGDDLTKGGKDIPSGPFKINSVKELKDLINKLIKSNVTNDVRIIFSDGTEFVFRIDGRTTEQIIKDMPIPKGMSPKGKEDLIKRMTAWVNKNTLKKIPDYVWNSKVWKFVTGQDILNKPWIYRIGGKSEESILLNRGAKILSRVIPTTYLYYSYEEGKFLSGGEYGGIMMRKLGLASDDIKNELLKQICDMGYQATYNEDTDTAGFNCERFYSEFYKQAENVVNSRKLDCETLLKNDYEENKKYLFSSLDKKYLKSELKSQNEKDYDGSAGDKWSKVKDTWDKYFNDYLGEMPGSEDWDDICQDLLDKKILACQVGKEKNDAQKDGYEWDEMKSSDAGGGGSQGTELPQF
jgi:hypothetical protein